MLRAHLRLRLSLAAAGLSALAIAGCGGGGAVPASTINNVTVERAIAESILVEDHVYTVVSCPTGVTVQDGGTFTCSALFQVGTYRVPVTQTNSSGHVVWDTKTPIRLLDMARVKRGIRLSIRKQRHVGAKVTCPVQVLQAKGLKFTCTAKTRGSRKVRAGTYVFRVTEANAAGYVTYVGI